MKKIVHILSGLTVTASLLIAPTLALAEHGDRGGEDGRASRSSQVQQSANVSASAVAQSITSLPKGDSDHGARSASVLSAIASARGDNEDNGSRHGEGHGHDCIVTTSASTSLAFLREDDEMELDDSEDCTVTATTTTDVTAPVLSSIVAVPAATSATITWTTNEPSSSKVFVSATTPVDVNSSTTVSVADASLVTNHSIVLTGLATSTTYHFVVRSADAANNVATSGESSFLTQSPTVANVPVLSSITATAGTSTANIAFTSDVPSVGTVFYGTLNPFNFINALGNPAQLTSHAFSLINLTASTTYFYVVLASNAIGSAVSNMFTFTTAALADTTAPVLSAISATTTAPTTATLTWTTNEPSTSKVFFGTTTPLALTSSTTAFVASSALVTNHSVAIPNLATSTTEHFVIQSADASGNTVNSSDIVLVIP